CHDRGAEADADQGRRDQARGQQGVDQRARGGSRHRNRNRGVDAQHDARHGDRDQERRNHSRQRDGDRNHSADREARGNGVDHSRVRSESMTIRKRKTWVAIAAITLASTAIFSMPLRADTITMTGLSPGQASVANKVAAPFSYIAGSPENAVALANALRTGTTATLSYTTTSTGTDSQTTTSTSDITVPTRPMGWGNVSHALALASYSLRQAGIEQPTAAELQAALGGGAITNANGQTSTLTGVLQQRASGMGWGQIAQSYGTTMGAVNRSIRVPLAVTAAPTSTSVATTSANGGSTMPSSRSVTTASGTTTASGATGTGVVTANGSAQGQAHAYGRGIVTANGRAATTTAATTTHGSSAGVITGNGAAAPVSNAGSGGSASHA